MDNKCVTTSISTVVDGHQVTMLFKQIDDKEVLQAVKEILLECGEKDAGSVENDI